MILSVRSVHRVKMVELEDISCENNSAVYDVCSELVKTAMDMTAYVGVTINTVRVVAKPTDDPNEIARIVLRTMPALDHAATRRIVFGKKPAG